MLALLERLGLRNDIAFRVEDRNADPAVHHINGRQIFGILDDFEERILCRVCLRLMQSHGVSMCALLDCDDRDLENVLIRTAEIGLPLAETLSKYVRCRFQIRISHATEVVGLVLRGKLPIDV